MRKTLTTLLLFLHSLNYSCSKINKVEENKTQSTLKLLSSSLESEVIKLIFYKKLNIAKSYSINNGICTILIHDDQATQECRVLLTIMSYVDTTKQVGYTYINNELIVCYIVSERCVDGLLNKAELKSFKDSIPNNINTSLSGFYDYPSYSYRTNNSELELIDHLGSVSE